MAAAIAPAYIAGMLQIDLEHGLLNTGRSARNRWLMQTTSLAYHHQTLLHLRSLLRRYKMHPTTGTCHCHTDPSSSVQHVWPYTWLTCITSLGVIQEVVVQGFPDAPAIA